MCVCVCETEKGAITMRNLLLGVIILEITQPPESDVNQKESVNSKDALRCTYSSACQISTMLRFSPLTRRSQRWRSTKIAPLSPFKKK